MEMRKQKKTKAKDDYKGGVLLFEEESGFDD